MKQSIQFPLVTKSENVYRGGNRFALASFTKTQREEVRAMLDKHFEVFPMVVGPEGERRVNRWAVTFTRICAGELDPHDNLPGSMKAVCDEVCAWLGVDDRNSRIRIGYAQERCARGFHAVRIEVEDESDDQRQVSKVVGANPSVLLPSSHDGARSGARRGDLQRLGEGEREADRRGRSSRDAGDRSARAALSPDPPGQQRIAFMKSYALLPWEQESESDATVVELPIGDDFPPATIKVPAPPMERLFKLQGKAVRISIDRGSAILFRHRWRHPALGDCWLYLADPAVRPDNCERNDET